MDLREGAPDNGSLTVSSCRSHIHQWAIDGNTMYSRRSVTAMARFSWIGRLVLPALLLSQCSTMPPERPFVNFQRHIINTRFDGDSQVLLADIDGDGVRDIVVMQHQPARLSWYRNPDWAAGAVSVGASRLYRMDAIDIDGNGVADLALLGDFEDLEGLESDEPDELQDIDRSAVFERQLRWLENPWRSAIDQSRQPDGWASHRIATSSNNTFIGLDPSGTGSISLLAMPEQVLFASSFNPRRPWSSVKLQEPWRDAGSMLVYDWDGDGRDDVLIARQNSVGIMALASRGRFVDWFELLTTEAPLRMLDVGHSGRAARRFIAAIEESERLVVFRPDPDASQPWQREVVEERLSGVNGLKVLDLARDGYDDVLVSLAGDGPSLLVYRYLPDTRDWHPITVDSGRAGVASFITGDVTGNGFLDIVVLNATTGQIVLHQNRGRDI